MVGRESTDFRCVPAGPIPSPGARGIRLLIDPTQLKMNHYQLTELVRARVRTLFAEMGAMQGPVDEPMDEAVLIRDGHYCGRRFEMCGNSAVWFIEENQIKCFTQEGALHSVVDATDDVAPRRAA